MTDGDRLLEEEEDRRQRLATKFLTMECELLDSRRWKDWLAVLTEDVRYTVPVRVTADESALDFGSQATWLNETKASLELRIGRLEAKYPVAERPPSRVRHFITNVRTQPGASEDETAVTSNVLVYRSRGETSGYDLFSAERKDVLRKLDGAWKLAKREVLLDQAVIEAQDLSFFF